MSGADSVEGATRSDDAGSSAAEDERRASSSRIFNQPTSPSRLAMLTVGAVLGADAAPRTANAGAAAGGVAPGGAAVGDVAAGTARGAPSL